ncbi:MAG: DegV family protein [Erysipelotrichaceae bacterium]|nr:DegV family protein [Erysipelotrichaceae bacterium]MDP3304864.1 DegV family protein [Erysipelotrichaceae bacterium]
MKKYVVMTDSGADLSLAEQQQLDIKVVRLPLMINQQTIIEETEINREQFIQSMKSGNIVKTAQPIVGDLLTMWDETLLEAEKVLYIPLSSGLSGSYQSAKVLSDSYEGRVVVVDAKLVCYPLQYVCVQAKKLLEEGRSVEEVKYLIEKQAMMFAALIPSSLEYLKRGGRMSSAAAALGSLLKITPILKVENGSIDVLDKVRTHKKAIDTALTVISAIDHPQDYHWYVVEADAIDLANEVALRLESIIHQPVVVRPIYPIIMAHTGPGTIGIGYTRILR